MGRAYSLVSFPVGCSRRVAPGWHKARRRFFAVGLSGWAYRTTRSRLEARFMSARRIGPEVAMHSAVCSVSEVEMRWRKK